jgi:hypothetical protein
MYKEKKSMKNHKPFLKAATVVVSLFITSFAQADAWRFGVMSDTQWKANLDGENPETVAVGIINQLNSEFISHDVSFVIQVGDLTDKATDSPNGNPSNRTLDTRAEAAQALYDAGIGFFPVRGNHEGSATAAMDIPVLFPQTTGTGPNVVGAMNFSSPFPTLNGLSYSFDYNNARFVLIDQFTRTDGSNYLGNTNNNAIDQLDWIDAQISGKGEFGIAGLDSEGDWTNAVNMNQGGTKKFVKGPWKAEYGLGAYGVDPSTKTAWAVVNYDGDFAVARDIEQENDRGHHGHERSNHGCHHGHGDGH